MKLAEAIKLKLSNLLEERKLSQYALCKNGGIPQTTISNIMHRLDSKVSVFTIYQICATLNITLEEFFADPIFDNLDD
ncbi:MAG: helix-turn-helix transcriptional regulator [Prevotella sp.]|nr:helix-turn-helix transcriptional regulator [Prevotella sp.]